VGTSCGTPGWRLKHLWKGSRFHPDQAVDSHDAFGL
jgi:hypothetical protein